MRNKVIFSLVMVLVFTFAISFVQAEANEFVVRDKAISCLINKVNASSQLTISQAIFAGLGGVHNSRIDNAFNAKKSANENCYIPEGESNCDLKTTAQVYMAKQRLGQNTTGILSWIGNQSGAVQGLIWYLQITMEDNEPSTCKVNYNGADYTFSIDSNMVLSSSEPGNCLRVADEGYRLRILDNCLENNFRVLCDVSESDGEKGTFITNFLYRQSAGSDALFVSPETKSARDSYTDNQIEAKCFKTGTNCDYEGSLWATAAFYPNPEFTKYYEPYLTALASENEKYFPEAFLNYLVKNDDQKVIGRKSIDLNSGGTYWDLSGSPYSPFYDTSLALLSLGGIGKINTLEYLDAFQGQNGCFGDNLEDTGFVIYGAGWSGRSSVDYCSSNSDCGSGRTCSSGICISINTCTSDSQCGSGQICSAGQCIANDAVCIDIGGTCSTECGSDQSQISASCDSGQICCILGGGGGGPIIPEGSTCEEVNATCRTECLSSEDSITASCSNEGDICCYETSDGGGDGPGAVQTACGLGGYFCARDVFACNDAFGQVKDREQYYCNNGVEVCCTVQPAEPVESCFNKGGEICSGESVCSGSIVSASDTQACCLDQCKSDGGGDNGGTPRCQVNSDCSEGEECSAGICLPVSGGFGWFWILLLLILIALVVLGIVFRDKLKIWWFKVSGKNKSGSATASKGSPPGGFPPRRGPPQFGPRPGFPMRPGQGPQGMIRRPAPMQQRSPQRPANSSSNPQDKEMEDTLKKLKDMSK